MRSQDKRGKTYVTQEDRKLFARVAEATGSLEKDLGVELPWAYKMIFAQFRVEVKKKEWQVKD